VQTYTKKELAYKLGVSLRTIEEDIEYLKLISTKGDRNTNLYSQSDFNLISQMRSHCQIKSNSRDSFIARSEVEIVDNNLPIVRRMPVQNPITIGLQSDPLFDLEILQRIADHGWLLPSNRLAPLFNISPLTRVGFLQSRRIGKS
jgi:hypothetical protein